MSLLKLKYIFLLVLSSCAGKSATYTLERSKVQVPSWVSQKATATSAKSGDKRYWEYVFVSGKYQGAAQGIKHSQVKAKEQSQAEILNLLIKKNFSNFDSLSSEQRGAIVRIFSSEILKELQGRDLVKDIYFERLSTSLKPSSSSSYYKVYILCQISLDSLSRVRKNSATKLAQSPSASLRSLAKSLSESVL